MNEDQTSKKTQRTDQETTFATSPPAPGRLLQPGDVIDNIYELTSELGQGGMGVVFACRHMVLGTKYAIKMLNTQELSQEYWSRFQAEAKVLARLNHPNIVGVYNMGLDGGQFPYYVMDLLSGEGLDSLVRERGRLPVNEALDLFIQVADALACAHEKQIVHRDIKPSNLMLVRDQQGRASSIKIVDFGIARLSKDSFNTQSQTATGLVFGTPYYMSPEQCQGERVDHRSDIYSLGCALFETLTGSPPLAGDNAFHTFMLHQNELAPTLASRSPEVSFPESLEMALAKMLAKSPAQRYQTMDQVKHTLERIRAGKEILPVGQRIRLPAGGGEGNQPLIISSRSRETEPPVIGRQAAGSPKAGGKAMIIAFAVVVLAAVGGIYTYSSNSSRKPPALPPRSSDTSSQLADFLGDDDPVAKGGSMSLPPDDEFAHFGSSEAEIRAFKDYDYNKFLMVKALFEVRQDKYLDRETTEADHFRKSPDSPYFQFPDKFVIGFIQFGDSKPIPALGKIAIPEGKRVRFFINRSGAKRPEIVKRFWDGDLNALEIVTDHPTEIKRIIGDWKKLDELSFFDALQKSPLGQESYDESRLKDDFLPRIERFKLLKSLGLSGDSLTGKAISKMPILHKIRTLKLKSIADCASLLAVLPTLPNIHELWLVRTGLTDEQLSYLVRMPNLESLRIRKSELTPESLQYFAAMKSLKHLYLDKNIWKDSVKEQFKREIPGCEFEPTVDFTYWERIPNIYLPKTEYSLAQEIHAADQEAEKRAGRAEQIRRHP